MTDSSPQPAAKVATLRGTVEPGFEGVRAAFERGFEKGELGAAVSAYVDGRKVVDLWGGWADAARTHAWRRDTIVTTFSATKGITATCAHRLVDQGVLDLNERVATHWPEFAQAGKAEVTVRMVLTHQAGLNRTSAPIPPEKRWDRATLTDALARSAPAWPPGTRAEYHGGTFGFLVGEVLRRIDGRPLDVYFHEEIAEPLGVDYLIRVGPEHDKRCAEVVGPDDMVGPANTREYRGLGDGAATSMGTADGLARVYAALARGGELDGVRVLRSATIAAAVQEQEMLPGDAGGSFGLGYQLLWKVYPALPFGVFGHTGMGGSIGLADPAKKLGFAFVANQIPTNGTAHLIAATYRAIGA